MAAATLSLSFGALSVMAPAAQAAPSATVGPCTVTAEKPYHQGHTPSGKKIVKYPISVKCTKGGVQVILKQRMMEQDGGWFNSDDTQWGWHTPAGTPLKFSVPGLKKVDPTPEYRLTRTVDDFWSPEEVYHQVKFSVSSNGVTSREVTVTSPVTQIRP